MDKHTETQKTVHTVFIDLEKAYGRKFAGIFFKQGVPEKYVRVVKDTYEDAWTQVNTSVGVTGKITVGMGLHQGSSLCKYLFDMLLGVMGRGIKEQPPLVYAVVLFSTRREDVETKLE